MNLEKFALLRPYLYHLTDPRNADKIIQTRTLICTNELTNRSILTKDEKREFVRTRRLGHQEIEIDGETIYIRDQDPLSINNLKKVCTTDEEISDFIEVINARVFFWPTIKDLKTHYGRYAGEKPTILRFKTADILELNPSPEFCMWNSGAPRCHPAYGGKPAPRNRDTFKLAEDADYRNSQVREFTVLDKAYLPERFERGMTPDGHWEIV